MLKNRTLYLLISILVFAAVGCSKGYEEKGSAEYVKSVKEWHNKRVESLKTKSIWLKLAGLYWLEEGKNTFGSSKDNTLIFPQEFEDVMGSISLDNGKLTLNVKEGVEITVEGEKITEISLQTDNDPKSTVMKYKDYWWYVIKRGEDRYGIRLINDKHPNLKEFSGIPTFPVNEDWKINAKWIPYNPVRTIEVPSVIGTSSVDSLYGAIVFEKDGKEYKLHAPGNGKDLFVIFADGTSGEETYGAGRFMSAKVDYEKNEVLLDFNKAYNPPCSFSKYATCPLPPEGNRLSLKITAGEKFEGHH